MVRTLFWASILALSFGVAAQAQETKKDQPPPAAAASGKDVSATAETLKTGMVVKDSAGVTLGRISKIGKTADGTEAVALNVDGQTLNLAIASLSLSPSGDQAVSNMSKDQILAAAPKPR